ncbi:MAG: hypothetical protein EOM66_12720 [Clostridia bacterium]|nr:hypothetical protein [Clostridia bacterium]
MHGGWGAPFCAMQSSAAQESMLGIEVGPLLFGRRTYENFYAFWPNQAEKYVASNTLTEPLPWRNSILLKGDVAAALTLMQQPGMEVLGGMPKVRNR